ncbi:DedD protein [Enterobacillus tribolii]|uniref:Cell division protein DedD n=1 Tax=Enterobacillus tribolii TaxID=1487935 RepID=A0A370QM75_9GAMM|nr:DedD protein [Enterobacillus tribolii]
MRGRRVASKFQNRLVGTIVIVALGVIVLPGVLDGQKKHYQDEFAAIPLVPKPGEVDEGDVIPPVTQPLSETPQAAAPEPEVPAQGGAGGQQNNAAAQPPQDVTVAPVTPPVSQPPPAQQPAAKPKPAPKPVEPPRVVEPKPKPESKPKPAEPVAAKPAKPVEPPAPKPAPQPQKPAATPEKAPAGQAYVVQLGALRNAARVNEIVAKLRLSGYRAYTVPATPVQGEITRLFVGPDASRQKLEASLGELNSISGLNGQVRSYGAK